MGINMKFAVQVPCTIPPRSWSIQILGGLLLILGWGLLTPTYATLTPHEYSENYDQALEKPQRTLNKLRSQDLTQFEFVLVTGFLNETIATNFFDWIAALQLAGVAKDQIHLVNNPSKNSVRTNSRWIHAYTQNLFESSERQIVFIAHSKGAVEVLLAALEAPEDWSERIQALILVQGAFGGSHLADYVNGQAIEPDERLGFFDRAFFRAGEILADLVGPFVRKGLNSMTTTAGRKWMQELQNLGRHSILTDRVHYMISTEEDAQLAKLIRSTGRYISTYYGMNDGVIEYDHQFVPGVGEILVDFEADHLDLVTSYGVSNTPYEFRQAVVFALLQSLTAP